MFNGLFIFKPVWDEIFVSHDFRLVSYFATFHPEISLSILLQSIIWCD